MLSYLHAFHAGNFADVHKHIGLFLALRLLQKKPSAVACFDTHGGSASYDLEGERPRKTGEADEGIRKLWACRDDLQHPLWKEVWRLLDGPDSPGGETLRFYPGSPAWFEQLARDQDRFTVFELHSGESQRLHDWAGTRRVDVRAEDGFAGLLRALPPKEPRLLTLIDPPYEVKDDYLTTAETVIKAWQRCRHGVYLVWYPILPDARHEAMIRRLQDSPVRKVLHSQYRLETPPERGMAGSGLLLVNPPWEWAGLMESMLEEVRSSGAIDARQRIDWAVPEA
ncbi:23S rRNA (adenine(2030)-N(6))-methyltransferase RlmJ [Marinobacter sp. JSM 1782161]|uniref:23S rRNA (adenine(2030)-N(6))-methyltransferase RlmJ n=1 Tax=Marinobacter sp. JSM 1782161 TaxID=2685906 RepID=UPI00140320DD|nr:23S rRNA (adenine(2030)-N(6))-methyltransferase RlmJ [Marinobacter sp. JSM 1782161]